MKKSRADTAKTRKRIVEIAASTFKSKGISATGVSEIMAAAGLTHGGFYRHFTCKEDLVAEACASSMDALVSSAEAAAAGGHEALLQHFEKFMSTECGDDTLYECPLVAMGSELVRANAETRRVASQSVEELFDILAGRPGPTDTRGQREEAIFTLASMIGAASMARIVDDPNLADRILSVAKKRLTSPSQGYSAQRPVGEKALASLF